MVNVKSFIEAAGVIWFREKLIKPASTPNIYLRPGCVTGNRITMRETSHERSFHITGRPLQWRHMIAVASQITTNCLCSTSCSGYNNENNVPHYWPFVWGTQHWSLDSPHKRTSNAGSTSITWSYLYTVSANQEHSSYRRVSEWLSLTAFWRTADIEVHIAYISRVIGYYSLYIGIVTFPHIDNTQSTGYN